MATGDRQEYRWTFKDVRELDKRLLGMDNAISNATNALVAVQNAQIVAQNAHATTQTALAEIQKTLRGGQLVVNASATNGRWTPKTLGIVIGSTIITIITMWLGVAQ